MQAGKGSGQVQSFWKRRIWGKPSDSSRRPSGRGSLCPLTSKQKGHWELPDPAARLHHPRWRPQGGLGSGWPPSCPGAVRFVVRLQLVLGVVRKVRESGTPGLLPREADLGLPGGLAGGVCLPTGHDHGSWDRVPCGGSLLGFSLSPCS